MLPSIAILRISRFQTLTDDSVCKLRTRVAIPPKVTLPYFPGPSEHCEYVSCHEERMTETLFPGRKEFVLVGVYPPNKATCMMFYDVWRKFWYMRFSFCIDMSVGASACEHFGSRYK